MLLSMRNNNQSNKIKKLQKQNANNESSPVHFIENDVNSFLL